jgi:hypothetical protein
MPKRLFRMPTLWSDDDGVSKDVACETDGSVVLSGMVALLRCGVSL